MECGKIYNLQWSRNASWQIIQLSYDHFFFVSNCMFLYNKTASCEAVLEFNNYISVSLACVAVRLWTFAAQYRASATQYPELQVWRETTTGRYVKVGNTSNMEPIQTAYLNVYEYVLDPPLQVLAGDVLGIYQPPSANSRLHLLFLENSSYVNWYTDVSEPQDSFMVTSSQRNFLPLVTVSFEPEGELNQHIELSDADGIIYLLPYLRNCSSS